jgi:hypothetical protein
MPRTSAASSNLARPDAGRRFHAGSSFVKTSSLAARSLGAVLAVLAILPVGSAAAANNWGSIYFSPSNLANGFSYRHASKRAAEDAAWENCDADDCIKAISFRNACGAVAVGENGGWGADWAPRGNEAQRKAIRACRGHDSGCYVLRWQCAN